MKLLLVITITILCSSCACTLELCDVDEEVGGVGVLVTKEF